MSHTTEPTSTKYTKDILEGNYLIGGEIHISNGEIRNNPFAKKIRKSKAAEWVLANEGLAKARIREEMRTLYLGSHEVDECYDYAISYFLESADREFDENYFGVAEESTYSIDIYCLFQLRMAVYRYRNEMRKRLANTVHIVDDAQDDSESLPKGCISFNVLNSERDSDVTHGMQRLNIEDIVDFAEFQYILDYELPKYDEKFQILGVHYSFKFREYIYYMFLDSSINRELDVSQLQKETAKIIATKMGRSVSWLDKINRLIRTLMASRTDFFGEVPGIIAQLVQGRNNGWEAVLTDEEDLD